MTLDGHDAAMDPQDQGCEKVSNPFRAAEVARRYADGRPYHHRRTVERCLALSRTNVDGLALDVACGTGLSTRALAELGFRVVGVDLTPAMVAVAQQQEGQPFAVAAAESLPVKDGSVALVTVGSGFHWFDGSSFRAEAARVLAPGGALLVYEHAGVGLANDSRFAAWTRDVYLARYPSPPTPAPFLGAVDAAEGLTKVATDAWEDTVAFSHEELVAYLLTQGNVSIPIDALEISADEARQWLRTETVQFFEESSKRDYSFLAMADVFVTDLHLVRSGTAR